LARYLFLLGMWWRRRAGKSCYDIPPSVHRRIMAGMLMGMMTVVLWPIVPAEMATIGGTMIAVPVLLGFTRDWLFTAGHLQSENPTYGRIQGLFYLTMARLFPPIWRLLLAISMLLILQAALPWYRPQAWLELLLSWHVPLPEVLATLLSSTAVIGTILVLLGFIGRLGAIMLLFPIGFDIATRGLVQANTLALVCAMCIALLGTGLLSLWQPEDAFIVQRRGGRD
jgi:CDP-diacylglycerol---glycerol-3-phosphate 3-phosphatidyltransferase